MFEGQAVNIIQNAIRDSKDIRIIARRENTFAGSEVVTDLASADHFSLALNMLFVNMIAVNFISAILLLFAVFFMFANLPVYALAFAGITIFDVLYMLFLAYAKSVAHGNATKIGYGFSQRGLFVKDSEGYLSLEWKLVRARETRRHYFFYYSTFGALIIPKCCINDAQKEMIEAFIDTFELKKKPSRRISIR